jgi:hypothetical protein
MDYVGKAIDNDETIYAKVKKSIQDTAQKWDAKTSPGSAIDSQMKIFCGLTSRFTSLLDSLVRIMRGKLVQDHASCESVVKFGDHCLSGGIVLSDEVGILKEFQEIEVILLADAEESSLLD